MTEGCPTKLIGNNMTSNTRTAPAHRPLFNCCAGVTGYAFMVVFEVTETTLPQSRQVDSADLKRLPSYASVRSAHEDAQDL